LISPPIFKVNYLASFELIKISERKVSSSLAGMILSQALGDNS
jgi:hypothetical protein